MVSPKEENAHPILPSDLGSAQTRFYYSENVRSRQFLGGFSGGASVFSAGDWTLCTYDPSIKLSDSPAFDI